MHNENSWKYVNLNPITPVIRGLIKIHKVDTPIRPVVNWKNAPAYRLARMFSEKIKTFIPLPYVFNVKNTTQLIKDMTYIPFDPKLKLTSFDITDMYSNIPTEEFLNTINTIYEKHNMEEKLKQGLMKI
jgi:hypothetical protein